MQKFSKYLFLFVILLSSKILAQKDKETTLTIGAQYQSDVQYLGRVDSIRVPLFVPSVSFNLKNGIFASAEGYFDGKRGSFDGGYIAAGYGFDKDNWGATFDVSKYFFKQATNLVRSDVKLSIDASLYYDFGFVTFNLEPTYNIGTGGSFVLGTGFSKNIEIEDVGENGKIEISPKLYSWFGSEDFIIQHNTKRRKKNITATSSKNQFQMMDIEVNLPASYIYNEKLKFMIDPQLAIPFNYKHLGGFYNSSSYPNPIFIFNIGVSYTFL